MATTTYYLSPISLLIQIFSNIGIPLQNGFVATYLAGTTTPVTTYTDSTGTTQNGNPIPLSSAGRLQSTGGAPVAVWVPAGVAHKMVITDQAGNFILALDNLTAINDPTAILALLAQVTSGGILGGADLIANAMRSYDVVASVRAAPVPTLATGQTLVIDVEGSILINDGLGGVFYWSPTSTATDDGLTVIKPTAITSANPGRYLRQSNLFGAGGTFLVTGLGFSGTAPTMTVTYVQNGNSVAVSWQGIQGVSNSTSFSLQGWPIGLRGLVNAITSPLLAAEDNSSGSIVAFITIQNQIGGNTVVGNNAGPWTATGTKGLFGGSFSYAYS